MSDILFTFEDGGEVLMHHGVKGMKWGVRNAETLRKYENGERSSRTKRLEKKFERSKKAADDFNASRPVKKESSRTFYASKRDAAKLRRLYGRSHKVLAKVYASKMRDVGLTPNKSYLKQMRYGMWSPKEVDKEVDKQVKRALKDGTHR